MPGPDRVPAASAKILVVDDEPAITVALAKKLRRDGYECVTAGSGEEALKRLASNQLDLVITDVRMPGMSGIELLKEVKRRDSEVQVILVTAYADIDFAVEALRNHADDYLLKPFNLVELSHSVSRCLEHGRLLQEHRYSKAARESGAENQLRADRSPMLAIAALASAIEARDRYTSGHVDRVARYALATGSELGLDGARLSGLWLGAVLHDVGKLKVPEEILNKPDSLTPQELRLIHQHPTFGATMVERVTYLEPARTGILQHHERWNGTGYPSGLEGEAISLEGRILAVADAFDAMLSDRPYRIALSEAEGLAEFDRCTGTQFDPGVAEAFLSARSKGVQPAVAELDIPDN